MALAGPRKLDRRGSHVVEEEAGVGANAVIWDGALVVVNAAGFLVPGTVAATHKKAAIARIDNIDGKVDNTGGANGAKRCRIMFGIYPMKIGAGGDALVEADRESLVYVMDDETVGKVSTGRSAAGKLVDVDEGFAWVNFLRD